jgi:mono/diheme cytochrome c family protein
MPSLVAAQAAPDGARVYTRCAACHTATGAGVPGAFPPLTADFRSHAASPAGRRYLVLVVTRGIMGPITVAGRAYSGAMPSHATLDDASVAAVLNHVGTRIAATGPRFRPFTIAEVATIRAGGATLAPSAVSRLRPGAPAR